MPLTDLSFDDREIILSQGPLGIYDYRSLLEFNQLVHCLGWDEGDWTDLLDWVEGGSYGRLSGNRGEETLTHYGGGTETQTQGQTVISLLRLISKSS